MQITLNRPDGLHILARATVSQLTQAQALLMFANGLIATALKECNLNAGWTLAGALHHVGTPAAHPLLTALLALDAEVSAVIEDATRVWPLPGFLSYRSRLPLDKYPLSTLRLPPLNAGGHYLLDSAAAGQYLAARIDLHPRLKVAGHVRLAAGGSTRIPQRLIAAEHRLDRQMLDEALIEAAVAAGSGALAPPLSDAEQSKLIEMLQGLIA